MFRREEEHTDQEDPEEGPFPHNQKPNLWRKMNGWFTHSRSRKVRAWDPLHSPHWPLGGARAAPMAGFGAGAGAPGGAVDPIQSF